MRRRPREHRGLGVWGSWTQISPPESTSHKLGFKVPEGKHFLETVKLFANMAVRWGPGNQGGPEQGGEMGTVCVHG